MKKKLIISLGIFIFITSNSSKIFASENSTIKYNNKKLLNYDCGKEKMLTDEFLDFLTIDDFCYVYNLLINEENILTDEELNEKSIEILTKIIKERIDTLKGILPDEYYHLNKEEKNLLLNIPGLL